MKNTLIGQFISMVKDELMKSKGDSKLLLLAMIVNIPSPLIFFGHLTQAITAFLVLFFLKSILEKKEGTIILFIIVGVTLLYQIFWLPFVSQLITITLLGLLFAVGRNKTLA